MEPITRRVRELAADINWAEITDHVGADGVDGDWLDAWQEAMAHACNSIDAIHANLEAENMALINIQSRRGRPADYVLGVRTFEMGTDKEAALKPLEEAAEAYAAWQEYEACDFLREEFADEIADCVQACCNLAERHGIDLEAAMERCERRNRDRGRYA